MGKFDSSKWRVEPVFDDLRSRDKTGRSWLPKLLTLPRRSDKTPSALAPGSIGPLEIAAWKSAIMAESGWDPRERALLPPKTLLEWLVKNVDPAKTSKAGTHSKRRLLGERHQATQDDALGLIARGKTAGKAWQILEGASFPDVYLQTREVIVVIEGKFTEGSPTTKTTWLDGRHQMLRHIDAAWDNRAGRAVYGFFIVEDERVPRWSNAVKETVDADTLRESLPHRSEEERSEIASAFLGLTTWNQVCLATGIPVDLIKPRPT